VRFIDTAKGQDCDVTGAYSGLRTGPRLLKDGHYALNPRREGFRHPGLFGAHLRMALGVTAHNKLLLVYVATPVTFARTAGIMKALGAVDAVCLDGGSSAAMYYRGRLIHRPGRRLTNIIEVHNVPRVTLVKLPPEGYSLLIARFDSAEPAFGRVAFQRSAGIPWEPRLALYEQAAVLKPTALRLFKNRPVFFPIDRPGLRRDASDRRPTGLSRFRSG
jgi:hypothetical protein